MNKLMHYQGLRCGLRKFAVHFYRRCKLGDMPAT